MRKRTTASPILKESNIEKVNDSSASSTKEANTDVKAKKDVIKRIPTGDRIRTLAESIGRNPFDAQLFYQRGILYFIQGKTTEALNDYNRAIKINPQFVQAYYARAELWAALNNIRQAMLNLEKAMELGGVMGALDRNAAVDGHEEARRSD